LVAPVVRPRGGPEPGWMPAPEARKLLSDCFVTSSDLRSQLTRWHARARGSESALVSTQARERAALQWAVQALDQGMLAVLWRAAPRVDGPFERPVPPPPPSRQSLVEDILDALEIELLDQDDEPFAGAAYVVTGPDGEVRRGRLSAQGYAYIPDVPAGQYKIQFPALEDDEPPEEAELLDIELVSTEGVPLGGFAYVATFSDGSTWEGTLDENGRAHLAPVPPGDFDVVFPALETEPADGDEEDDANAEGDDDRVEPEDGGEPLTIDESTDPTPEVAVHDHHDAGDGDQEQALVGAKAACRPPSAS
jgi:hypothetical protein